MNIENKDYIIEDPMTGGKMCYVTEITPEIKNFMSLSSGFWTNSLCKKGSEFYEEQILVLPDLYKELQWEDPNTNLVWFPQTINIPSIGMVFANGTGKENWGWSAVLSVPVKPEEKEKYPIPNQKGKFYEKRMDMTTIKHFNKDQFVEALNYIGVL